MPDRGCCFRAEERELAPNPSIKNSTVVLSDFIVGFLVLVVQAELTIAAKKKYNKCLMSEQTNNRHNA